MNIEPLELRIAPASVTPFNDVDGDLVTITISKVTANDIIGAIFLSPGIGKGQHLVTLDLRDPKFEGVNVSITAKPDPAAGGDGTVNVGYINANGRDLGTVFVEGDLGAFDAGNSANAASASKGLTVHSLGRFGTSTGAPSLDSVIDGRLDKLTVKFDVKEAFVSVTDSAGTNGKIGSVFIGGSVIGGTMDGSGQIYGQDGLGPVTIKGDIFGGGGTTSGSVTADLPIASVTVGGSLFGGAGLTSGVIFSSLSSVGPVKIGGNLEGGDATNSGRVFGKTKLTSVNVGGSVLGGGAVDTGKIHSDGTLGSLTIRGSLTGSGSANTGRIHSTGAIGSVKIGGNIEGGDGNGSGQVSTFSTLASLTLGGSLLGGSLDNGSGSIFSSGAMGTVKIGGNIEGGNAPFSGQVRAGTLGSLTLGGSLLGGTAIDSGRISVAGAANSIKIGGNIEGSASTGLLTGTGFIGAQRLASLFVGGSIISGTSSGPPITFNGYVAVGDDLGSITVEGSLIGNATNPVLIIARGQSTPGATSDLAIKSLSVGGRVEFAQIRAGYHPQLFPLNADAQIGAVTVGGDWISSSLIAGVDDGADNYFGSNDDVKISGAGVKDNADNGGAGAVSKIASVIIKGRGLGSVSPGDLDTFGIVAQQIGSLKIGSVSLPFTAGAGNDLFAQRRTIGPTVDAGGNPDFSAFEVPLT